MRLSHSRALLDRNRWQLSRAITYGAGYRPPLGSEPLGGVTCSPNGLPLGPLLRSPYPIDDFHVIDCVAVGFGMKSRLPVLDATWAQIGLSPKCDL
jgi:hypothetical protein